MARCFMNHLSDVRKFARVPIRKMDIQVRILEFGNLPWENSGLTVTRRSKVSHSPIWWSITYGPPYWTCKVDLLSGKSTKTLSAGENDWRFAFLSYHPIIFTWASPRFCLARLHASVSLDRKLHTQSGRLVGGDWFINHFYFNIFKGPLTLWPNTSSAGLKPRDSWVTSLAAKRSKGFPSSQCFLNALQ